MLKANHPHAAALMFERSQLDLLLTQIDNPALCHVILIKKQGPKSPAKRLFHVLDAPLSDLIRHHIHGLHTLRSKLKDLEVDFVKNQGLWVPAIADADLGDHQVNLMISKSWVTKSVSKVELLDFAGENQHGLVLRQLDHCGNDINTFRICREAGNAYRVAIRNSEERRVLSVHEFCIVLGEDVVINKNDPRHRSKREDAWRGVVPPLFTFSGKRGQLWWVYPAQL